MPKPTIIDVANHAGVSKSTVSLVINNSDAVHPDTVAKVWKSIEALNYVPSRAARALQSGRSNLIGLIVSDITNPYFSELVRSTTEAARQHDYDVVSFDTNFETDSLKQCVERILEHRVDGVFLFTTERDLSIIERLRANRLPTVLLNWGITERRISDLAVNYLPGMQDLVKYIISYGHKRIAFIAGSEDYYSAVAREKAFCTAYQEVKSSLEDLTFIRCDFRLSDRTGIEVVEQILAIDPDKRPTAVVASNDLMAISIMRAFQSQGIEIPEQISITGVDDINLTGYVTPALTTLRIPRREMGKIAFQKLQEFIEQDSDDDFSLSVSVRLIERESVSEPPH